MEHHQLRRFTAAWRHGLVSFLASRTLRFAIAVASFIPTLAPASATDTLFVDGLGITADYMTVTRVIDGKAGDSLGSLFCPGISTFIMTNKMWVRVDGNLWGLGYVKDEAGVDGEGEEVRYRYNHDNLLITLPTNIQLGFMLPLGDYFAIGLGGYFADALLRIDTSTGYSLEDRTTPAGVIRLTALTPDMGGVKACLSGAFFMGGSFMTVNKSYNNSGTFFMFEAMAAADIGPLSVALTWQAEDIRNTTVFGPESYDNQLLTSIFKLVIGASLVKEFR